MRRIDGVEIRQISRMEIWWIQAMFNQETKVFDLSYNIDEIKVISGQLFIHDKVAKKLLKKHKNELPEMHFLENSDMEFTKLSEPDANGMMKIDDLLWGGEGSGSTFDTLMDILENTKGEAEILIIWEGGDSIQGFRIKDGEVTEKKVKITME